MICGTPMSHYFTKPEVPGLGDDEFHRCPLCGFVCSKTMFEMPEDAWERLNKHCHEKYQGSDYSEDDPRWRERMAWQAEAIRDAERVGLINRGRPWLDYACGDGRLADQIGAEKYEPYMSENRTPPLPCSYNFVLTTSVFEHLRKWEHLESIEELVAQDGVMGLHTLICEEVPKDPDWFYLFPMHCALFTNRSMEILLRDWGYACSTYAVKARLWMFFKSEAGVEDKAKQLGWEFKRGFCDYWKGTPARFNRETPCAA
jgi:hypothetical protein